jgi:hypothetical protein
MVLVFLFPLALYCFFLAYLNRRQRPTMVSGPWDFVGVLFAASGFLLVGGPEALSAFYERQRFAWARGEPGSLPEGEDSQLYFWLGLWALYFVGVLAWAGLMLWRRRGVTAIYNIDPATFDEILPRVLNRVSVEWWRVANRVTLTDRGTALDGAGRSNRTDTLGEASAVESPPSLALRPEPQSPAEAVHGKKGPGFERRAADQEVVLDLDPFPVMSHVTLHWRGEGDELRKAVETDLAKALAEVHSGPNPMGGWFLSLAVCFFSVLIFAVALIVISTAFRVSR